MRVPQRICDHLSVAVGAGCPHPWQMLLYYTHATLTSPSFSTYLTCSARVRVALHHHGERYTAHAVANDLVPVCQLTVSSEA